MNFSSNARLLGRLRQEAGKLGRPVALKIVAKAWVARRPKLPKRTRRRLIIRKDQGSGVGTLSGVAHVLQARGETRQTQNGRRCR